MVRTKLKMNTDIKEAFAQMKPVCDVLMVCPTVDSLLAYTAKVADLKNEVVQELQQYLLFPLITLIKGPLARRMIDMHLLTLDAIRAVLERVTVNSFEMFMKLETSMLSIIVDVNKPGMVSDAPEEMKLSTVRCMNALMLSIPREYRIKLLNNNVPMLAQAIFVLVHIAKLERLRCLRSVAIESVMAHTMVHPWLAKVNLVPDEEFELLLVDNMLCSILPGVLGALQDVCTCSDNPNYAVVTASIMAIHRIMCIPMNDKYFIAKNVTTADFVHMLNDKDGGDTDVSSKAQKMSKLPIRSAEWFEMAGEKLTVVTHKIVALRLYDHPYVRKELAVFCNRIINECSSSMPLSVPYCIDVLISMSKDCYTDVASYCSIAVEEYFSRPHAEPQRVFDSVCDAFVTVCASVPRVLNDIDDQRKVSILRLLHGYLKLLSGGRPQKLTAAVSVAASMQQLCAALTTAALHSHRLVPLTRLVDRDVQSPPPLTSPWTCFKNLGSKESVSELQQICVVLGGAECAELVLDVLLDMFQHKRECEPVYVLNWMVSSPHSTTSMAKRILIAYIELDTWYLPLEIRTYEKAPTAAETYDVTVYNPRAWHKERVPGLYEGTVETRYTDLSLLSPREPPPRDPRHCATLAEAQRNLLLSCLLTEGVGIVASRLKDLYQPYLLKTLCLILERVGSEYELLHMAGLKAINEMALACGHDTVAELIQNNADYFINQITVKLKKEWQCQSALQILSVVLEYSEGSILYHLYDIVENVANQSSEKYQSVELPAYLQAFLTFVERVRVWYPPDPPRQHDYDEKEVDLLAEVREYVKDTQEAERLLSDTDFEKSCGMTVEEMYKEDMKKKEEEELNYDDGVKEEKPPLPQHVALVLTILKRSVHFLTSRDRNISLLALLIMQQGLPLVGGHEDSLLPLVHASWAPLVACFHSQEPVVMMRAVDLLATVAQLAGDFIQERADKEILPEMYRYLARAARDSCLQDAGSAYRAGAAYRLQLHALGALCGLTPALRLSDARLGAAMRAVRLYLSDRQPRPLQAKAVKFFLEISQYEYCAVWYYMRELCDNDVTLQPPPLKHMSLAPVVGAPFQPAQKEYEVNVRIIYLSITA